MASQEELHEMVKLCQVYIAQEHAMSDWQVVALEDYTHFKEHALKSKQEKQPPVTQKKVEPPPKLEPVKKPEPVVIKKVEPIQERKEELKPKEAHLKREEIPQFTSMLLPSFLPRPFHQTEVISFGEIQEKLEKLAPQLKLHEKPLSDETAVKKASEWKENAAQIVILSLIPEASPDSQFVKTMTEGITQKLKKTDLIILPNPEMVAKLVTLSLSGAIRAFILIKNGQTEREKEELLSLFSPFQNKEKKLTDIAPLKFLQDVYNTPLYELELTASHQTTPSEKALLWAALKKLVLDL